MSLSLRGYVEVKEASAKHEVDRSKQAQPRPEEVQVHRLPHVQDGEGHEHGQRDHLLRDFQLRQRDAQLTIAAMYQGRSAMLRRRRDRRCPT